MIWQLLVLPGWQTVTVVYSVLAEFTDVPLSSKGPESTVTGRTLVAAGGGGGVDVDPPPPPPQAVTSAATRVANKTFRQNLLKHMIDIDTGWHKGRRVGVAIKVARVTQGFEYQTVACHVHRRTADAGSADLIGMRLECGEVAAQ